MKSEKGAVQWFVKLLVFVTYTSNLFFQPLYANSASKQSSVSLPLYQQENELIEFNEDLTEVEQQKLSEYFHEPINEASEIMRLVRKLQKKERRLIEHFGEEVVQKQIRSRKEKFLVDVSIPNVGRAEIVSIGKGERARAITRVVHERTGNGYLIVDVDKIPLNYMEINPNSTTAEEYEEELYLRKYLSFHLRSYIARQLLLSGRGKNEEAIDEANKEKRVAMALTGDADELVKKPWYKNILKRQAGAIAPMNFEGKPLARDFTVVFVSSGKHIKTEHHRSPRSKLEASYWQNYWYAIYEKPDHNEEYWRQGLVGKLKTAFTGDYLLGWFFAGLQAGAALTLGYAQQLLSPNPNLADNTFTAIATTSLVFGLILGVMTKTFQNWNKIGGLTSQSIKSWAVSLSYGFAYALQVQGLGGMALWQSGGGINMSALNTYFLIFSNTIIKGWFKTWSMQIPYFKRDMGESLEDFYIPNKVTLKIPLIGKVELELFDKPINTKIEKSGIDSQMFQFLGTIPKIAHLTDMQVHLPGIGNIPAGQISYVVLIPVFHYWAVRYTENYAREADEAKNKMKLPSKRPENEARKDEKHKPAYQARAELYRQSWEDTKFAGIPYLKTVSVGIARRAYNIGIRAPRWIYKNTVKPAANAATEKVLKPLALGAAPSIFAMGLAAHAADLADTEPKSKAPIEIIIRQEQPDFSKTKALSCSKIFVLPPK